MHGSTYSIIEYMNLKEKVNDNDRHDNGEKLIKIYTAKNQSYN